MRQRSTRDVGTKNPLEQRRDETVAWNLQHLGAFCDTGFAEFDLSDFTWRSDVPNLDLPTLVPKPVTKPGVVKKPSADDTAFDHAERKRISSRGYHSVAKKYKSHPDCKEKARAVGQNAVRNHLRKL